MKHHLHMEDAHQIEEKHSQNYT